MDRKEEIPILVKALREQIELEAHHLNGSPLHIPEYQMEKTKKIKKLCEDIINYLNEENL